MGGGGGKRHPLKAVVAGGLAGAMEAVISYPTEYIKTQLQLFPGKGLSPVQCARETVAANGLLGLYRGLPALLWFSVPKVSSRFFAFETLSEAARSANGGKLTTVMTLLCGMGAGTCEAIVAVTPMDTIKTRLIHDQLTRAPAERKYRGFFHGVRTIVGEQGLGGVYKGLTATILKQSSNQAIRWVVFLNVKQWFAGPGGDVNKLGVAHTMAASVAAGVASVYGNTPVDVIKTRMQGLEAAQYKNTWDCARQIMLKEGPRAFYKGATARMARVCLDVSAVRSAGGGEWGVEAGEGVLCRAAERRCCRVAGREDRPTSAPSALPSPVSTPHHRTATITHITYYFCFPSLPFTLLSCRRSWCSTLVLIPLPYLRLLVPATPSHT
jgi:solute carrier family 25 citrate transporter 1